MTETNTAEITEDMRFCLEYLAARTADSEDAERAFRGAQYMSLALDGLSGMLRALPEATQKQMAQYQLHGPMAKSENTGVME